ncbi:MAG: tetratricopeptide repeat protein [Bacteroidaceae bacterium]|nr:tetratricopeptide repeat protein [Bacteroidaceae bacterium]
MKKSLFILTLLLALAGCGRSGMTYNLKSLEKSLLERSVEAGINLDSLNKTYHKGYNKRYRLAKGWYALGQSYSDMGKDPEAIYALLKARELFTDTLSADYASTLYLLGRHYNNRGLYDDAVNTFSTSRRLYQKLGDNIMVSMTDYNLGVAYFGKKDYSASRGIFENLLNNRYLDAVNRNSCYLYLAYIENDQHYMEGAGYELELANKYLAGCSTESERVPGYAIKGIALYYLHENDSAFVYLEKAHRLSDDLNTKILALTGLEWVATQMKRYQAAWNAEIWRQQYQDELNRMSNQSEIAQIQLQHNDEMQKQQFRARVSRVVWISISLIIIMIAAAVIYSIQRDRRREAYYLKKYDDLIQKQIEEKSNSEGNRLMEACEAFRTGIAFNLVNDVALQKRSFRQEERDVVVHDINLYFANPIAVLRAEAGKLGQQDINLIFCTLLGFDQELTADIMCTSRSNMRSIKSRLKSKISAESFALYFKE